MLTEKDYCDLDTSHELWVMGLEPEAYYDGPIILLYEAQKWLREQRLLCIEIYKILYGGYRFHVVDLTTYTEESCGDTDGYEEALLEGIKQSVKFLKEK